MRDLMNNCIEEMLAYSKKMIKELLVAPLDHKIVHERANELGH